MNEQLTIFDMIQQETGFPCDDCVFDERGGCDHLQTPDAFCVNGSFRISHRSLLCTCGGTYQIRQSEFGSDWGVCRCGSHKIFRNQGNRLGYMEAYRQGLIR